MRAHSTAARHPVEWTGVVGFGLAVETLGEVATRFKVLGCIGDKGVESERRNVLFESVRGPFSVTLRGVDGGIGFAASVSVFKVKLMTHVAKTVLSLTLSCSSREAGFFVAVALFPFNVVVADVVGREAEAEAGKGVSVSTRSNSLRATTVAGVHVAVEEMAALTASEDACNEAMRISM